MPDSPTVPRIVRIDTPARWHAVASPIRQQVLQLLEDGAEWTVRALAEAVGRTPQAMYRHVQILQRAGLIRCIGAEGSATYALNGRLALDGLRPGEPFAAAFGRTVDRLFRSLARVYRTVPAPDRPVQTYNLQTALLYLSRSEARELSRKTEQLLRDAYAARERSAASGEPTHPYNLFVGIRGLEFDGTDTDDDD